jgi:hypothetical protein
MFHVNPETGDVGRCKATKGNCPFGSVEEHYASADDARSAFEASNESFATAAPVTLSETAEAALSAELTWSGTTPEWLEEDSAKQRKLFGTEPRVIAVLPSPIGDLAAVWQEDSLGGSDANIQLNGGYEINAVQLRTMDTGSYVGFITMTSVSDASFKRSFGDDEWTPFAWAEEAKSGSFGFEDYQFDEDNRIVKDDEGEPLKTPTVRTLSGAAKVAAKRELWANSFRSLEVTPPDFDRSKLSLGLMSSLKVEHAPEDEAKLDKDLSLLRRKLRKEIKERRDWHAEAVVGYVELNEELRGKGIGHALYILGARMQATRGRPLRGSGLQSDAAQSSWSKMKRSGLPVKPITKTQLTPQGKKKLVEFFTLDFRNDSN